jgi:mannose-6-phosphate isomerase-like protein (cupin superfamily)/quercetin dioxygenase-like cupin family protein
MSETGWSSASVETPVLLKWQRYRRFLRWEPGERSYVGRYPGIEGDAFRGHMLVLPLGHGSASLSYSEDVVFVGIQGEMEVAVGSERYLVGPYDVLAVTAPASITYRQVGLEPALCCELAAEPHQLFSAHPDATTTTTLWRWDETRLRFRWHLPFASTWGYHRGSGPHISVQRFSGHMIRALPSQRCPWHATARNFVVIQLVGEVEWRAAGQPWFLEPRDFLLMRPDIPYEWRNCGMTETVFLVIGSPHPANKAAVYWKDDPGWPIRPDAEVMPTRAGVGGQRLLA